MSTAGKAGKEERGALAIKAGMGFADKSSGGENRECYLIEDGWVCDGSIGLSL